MTWLNDNCLVKNFIMLPFFIILGTHLDRVLTCVKTVIHFFMLVHLATIIVAMSAGHECFLALLPSLNLLCNFTCND